MNGLYQADYVIAAFALGGLVFGLFAGFSGALSFCAGLVSAGAAVKFGYAFVAAYATSTWVAWLGTMVVALLAFGLARLVVKRIVHGILAQPADAIFGAIIAAVTGLLVSLSGIWAAQHFGGMEVESRVFQEVMNLVR